MLSVAGKFILSCVAVMSFHAFSFSEKPIDWTNQNPLIESEINTIKNLKFVLVEGLLNEQIFNYYKTPIQVLTKDLGVPKKNIRLIGPPSGKDIQANADSLIEEIRGFVDYEEKFVLIGHSKGSIESLLALLKEESSDLHQNLHAAILIQGAMKGSPVCNYMCGKGGLTPDSMMGNMNLLSFKVTSSIGGLMCNKYHDGFQSLFANTTEAVLEHYKTTLTKELDEKIFYVTSHQDPAKMSMLISCVGHYLQTYYGLNDGLVLQEDQSINWVGKVIANLTADHAGLLVGKPISNASKGSQKIFFTNLLRFLASSDL